MSALLPSEVVSAVLEALPHARLEDASVLGEGWSVVAYRVPAEDGEWVLRVPREGRPEAVTGDLDRECALVPWLQRRGLEVPRDLRALRTSESRLLGTLHRLVAGRPATAATRGERGRLAHDLGAFLTRLHALPVAEARAHSVPALELWSDRYAPMVEECLPLLGPASAAWLDRTVARFLEDGGTAAASPVLVHGDLGQEHVRLRVDGGLEAVIDWGDAMIADPAIDFAALRLTLGDRFMERVLGAYEGPNDLDLRRRARFYVNVVPLFLVRYGYMFNSGDDRRAGLRQLAARASAAARRIER